MSSSTRTTLIDLVLHLRERILQARAVNSSEELSALSQCIDIMRDVAWAKADTPLALILQDMLDSVMDAIRGEPWKSSPLLSAEDIVKELS